MKRAAVRSASEQALLGALLGALAFSPGGTASLHGQASPDEIRIVFVAGLKRGGDPLRTDSMYSNMVLAAGGGASRHTLALEVDDGLVLVDTKLPAYGTALKNRVRLASANDVTLIINTNPGGAVTNSAFPTVVDIVAHESTRAMLAKSPAFQSANARFLPNKTFSDKLTIPLKTVGGHEGTNRVDLYHFGPAHSSGDIIAVFPSFALAYFGELMPDRGRLPTIDTANGGSALAFPDTLARAVAALKDSAIQTIVPGYAPAPAKAVTRWVSFADAEQYSEVVRAAVDAITLAHAAGKSVDDAAGGLQLQNARPFVETAYQELKK